MVLGRRVVILDQLRLRRSLAQLLGLPAGHRWEEPHLALELDQLLIGVRLHFQALELLYEGIAREVLVHLGRRDQLALLVLDLLGHALERLEHALVADRGHGFLDALVRFCRAIRMFFLRFASSIRSFSWRSDSLSFSVSSRCFTHVSCSCTAPCACSLCRSNACFARSSRPSCTANTARRSQSSALFFSCSTWAASRFSSAIAAATCCLAFASWLRMSTISWLSIFSGFSAREIRSLMFDRISVERRSKTPIGILCVVA